jgi:hypothetical protein
MDTRIRGWRASDGPRPVVESRWLAERTFGQDDVPAVRRFAAAFGARAGLGSARLTDFVLAASEAVACATAWGPCVTRVRLWLTGRRAFCEVRGDAMMVRRATQASTWQGAACGHGGPGHGRTVHGRTGHGRTVHGTACPDGPHGEEAALRRWVLRQVSDYVSVASGPDGPWVLLSMSVAGR